MNIVIVRGTLLDRPRERQLGEDRTVLVGTILVDEEGRPRESVPFSWFDPPAGSVALDGGVAVVATGRLQRRFFRSGGRTESITDLVVGRLHRDTHRRRVATALRNAVEEVEALASDRAGR